MIDSESATYALEIRSESKAQSAALDDCSDKRGLVPPRYSRTHTRVTEREESQLKPAFVGKVCYHIFNIRELSRLPVPSIHM